MKFSPNWIFANLFLVGVEFKNATWLLDIHLWFPYICLDLQQLGSTFKVCVSPLPLHVMVWSYYFHREIRCRGCSLLPLAFFGRRNSHSNQNTNKSLRPFNSRNFIELTGLRYFYFENNLSIPEREVRGLRTPHLWDYTGLLLSLMNNNFY